MQQVLLDSWFLRQDVLDQLLAAEEDSDEAARYADRIQQIAESEEAEHQTLVDPFDRSVALVLSLVKEEGLDPWNIDLGAFLKLFTERVRKEASDLDLPACGRLIRLSWEVLHNQAAILFERVQAIDFSEEEFIDFGWESDYDDEGFVFTQTILAGEADEVLPNLFDERVRRNEEGRPVTLGELLSALKDACDDAEVQKVRDENRILHAEELAKMLSSVDSRMHDENLESDIEISWRAMRQATKKVGKSEVELSSLGEFMLEELAAKGFTGADQKAEAKVTSFIACLFLANRGYAQISQKEVPAGQIVLSDLCPDATSFQEAKSLVELKNNPQPNLQERAAVVKDSLQASVEERSEVVGELDGWLVE
ncbi:MAG: hypothetical protein ACKVJ7_03520 [Candidatus Poseidoniales archaeon]